MAETFGIFYVVIVLVVLFAAILWILLPFAVFGIKPKLDAMLTEARQMNALLKSLYDQQRVLVEQQKLMLPRTLPAVPKIGGS